MSYSLAIHPAAEKEWHRLDGSIRARFKTKLAERLQQPRIPKDALHGLPDCYKLKLTTPQYRLVYHVDTNALRLTILAIASRDDVYTEIDSRLHDKG